MKRNNIWSKLIYGSSRDYDCNNRYKIMIGRIFTCVILLLVSAVACAQNTKTNSEADDFHTILSDLLGVNKDVYTYVDSQGVKQTDSLKQFKVMEAIYMKYVAPDLPSKKFSEKHLKVLLFLAFDSDVNNNAAFLEYLAGDLVPIYKNNKRLFLSILNEQHYMIPAVCGRLNAYFGFEGKHMNDKPDFLQKNTVAIKKELQNPYAQTCLNQFK